MSEARAMINAPVNQKHRILPTQAYDTGIRRNELLNITLKTYSPNGDYPSREGGQCSGTMGQSFRNKHFPFREAFILLLLFNVHRKIVIYISAQDLNAAKATINSVLRWISTASEVISTFSKQT